MCEVRHECALNLEKTCKMTKAKGFVDRKSRHFRRLSASLVLAVRRPVTAGPVTERVGGGAKPHRVRGVSKRRNNFGRTCRICRSHLITAHDIHKNETISVIYRLVMCCYHRRTFSNT